MAGGDRRADPPQRPAVPVQAAQLLVPPGPGRRRGGEARRRQHDERRRGPGLPIALSPVPVGPGAGAAIEDVGHQGRLHGAGPGERRQGRRGELGERRGRRGIAQLGEEAPGPGDAPAHRHRQRPGPEEPPDAGPRAGGGGLDAQDHQQPEGGADQTVVESLVGEEGVAEVEGDHPDDPRPAQEPAAGGEDQQTDGRGVGAEDPQEAPRPAPGRGPRGSGRGQGPGEGRAVGPEEAGEHHPRDGDRAQGEGAMRVRPRARRARGSVSPGPAKR